MTVTSTTIFLDEHDVAQTYVEVNTTDFAAEYRISMPDHAIVLHVPHGMAGVFLRKLVAIEGEEG